MYMETTIRLSNNVKEKLNTLKVHSRESYNDVIYRILEGQVNAHIDKDSLIETIDVLSDPETMRDIAQALEDYRKGKFIELK